MIRAFKSGYNEQQYKAAIDRLSGEFVRHSKCAASTLKLTAKLTEIAKQADEADKDLMQACNTGVEVLQLVAEGKANKQTASELGIGLKTVEKHREHLMEKLDIHDTAGLTRYAISAGIIESSVQLTIL